jgi:glutathione peroxidase
VRDLFTTNGAAPAAAAPARGRGAANTRGGGRGIIVAISPKEAGMASVYDFSVKDIHGKSVDLARYKGKALLIVNTASKCGFTPQYKGLEALYRKMHGKGLEILGFPCNQFGAQEPGSESEIESFCEVNYGVTFPLFAKIDVNGRNAAPLYRYLKKAKPGLLRSEVIKWNFTKFLVDRQGNVVARYAPNVEPESLAGDIAKVL